MFTKKGLLTLVAIFFLAKGFAVTHFTFDDSVIEEKIVYTQDLAKELLNKARLLDESQSVLIAAYLNTAAKLLEIESKYLCEKQWREFIVFAGNSINEASNKSLGECGVSDTDPLADDSGY